MLYITGKYDFQKLESIKDQLLQKCIKISIYFVDKENIFRKIFTEINV